MEEVDGKLTHFHEILPVNFVLKEMCSSSKRMNQNISKKYRQ